MPSSNESTSSKFTAPGGVLLPGRHRRFAISWPRRHCNTSDRISRLRGQHGRAFCLLLAASLVLPVLAQMPAATAADTDVPASVTKPAADEIAVSINAGETYVIKDVDPDFTSLVNYLDDARAFTVQSSSRGTLVVLGVERGSGTITVARDGERVRYEVTVDAIFDARHPLSPGKAPEAISDDDDEDADTDAKSSSMVSSSAAKDGISAADSTRANDAKEDRRSKISASEAVSVTGPPPTIRDLKISAEPDDSEITPGAAAPSRGVAAPSTAALEPGAISGAGKHPAGRAALSTVASAPSPLSDAAHAADREPIRRKATAAGASASSDPGKSVPVLAEAPEKAASAESGDLQSKRGTAVPATGATGALPLPSLIPSTDESRTVGPAKLAAGVAVVPSQSVDLQPPLPRERFTSNPPTAEPGSDEAASAGVRPLPAESILLTRGLSRIFSFPARIRRVSISDTSVADIQVINPHQLMLLGRQAGLATLEVWDRQGNVEERQIVVDRSGAQQVMLNVVIAEINRGRLENQGLNYSTAFTKLGFSLVSLPGLVASPFGPQNSGSSTTNSLPNGGSLIPMLLSPNLTYGLAAQNSNVSTQTFFQFLEDHNLGRVLARPRLLANSGEQARFLSGGEIPIIVSQALNTSIVFKQFGTSVIFLPTVIGHNALQLAVKSEVSSPDFSQGVVENGFSVPAFITRRAQTAVRMAENQTLIIAGLILDQTTSNVNKVPFLGDIPFLGYAFRTSSYNHSKTELIMTVTPEIVQPIPVTGEVALPTERAPLGPQEIRTVPLSPPDITRPRPW
jgi:Flp pilus assembly secretin CpaC